MTQAESMFFLLIALSAITLGLAYIYNCLEQLTNEQEDN